MFFLQQISTQFKLQLANHDMQGGLGGGEPSEEAFPLATPGREARILPGSVLDDLGTETMSQQDLQEFVAEFEDRLGGLTLNREFVAGQLQILINGLTPIARGDLPGYDTTDPEYAQLRATITRLGEIHQGLVSEIGELNTEIQTRLQGHVEHVGDYMEYAQASGGAENAPEEPTEQEIEFERLEAQRQGYEGTLNEKIENIPDSVDSGIIQSDFEGPIRELISGEVQGENQEERNTFLEQQNIQIITLLNRLDRYIFSNTPEVVYTPEMLEQLEEQGNADRNTFRNSFFTDILGEELQEGDLADFSSHEKVIALSGEDGDEYAYNLAPLLEEFDNLVFTQGNIESLDLQQQGELLSYNVLALERLNRQMGIISRDISILEGETTFQESRLDTTHEHYENLMRNGEELTELGELIASNSGNLPEFEDLGIDHIQILRDNNVNLARLFLVDSETGNAMESGILQEGSSYVINFSANSNLQRQMDFTFISTAAQQISVDGRTLTLNRNSENTQGVGYYDENGIRVPLLDGSQITILSVREEVSPHQGDAIDSEVDDRIQDFANSSTENRAFVEAALRNPTEAFMGETLPGGIAGAFIAILLNMFDGRNFVYNSETGTWEERPEGSEQGSGSPLTNGEVVAQYLGGMELGSLSAEFESSSQGAFAYNPDDNGYGPSYGTYQMNSEVGVYRSFIQRHGITEGRDGWMAAIEQYGVETFQEMEHQHIKENNYDPMMNRITISGKENFTLAMQNVIWSIGVQHGPGHGRLLGVINNSGVIPGDVESEARLINALYDERGRVWPAGIESRYNRERVNALSMLESISIGGIVSEGGIYNQNLSAVPSGIVSYGVERSASGTTLCSRTARRNLGRLGVQNVNQGASARDSFHLYPSEVIQPFPPRNQTEATVADFYLDASANNAQYGHRVAAFQENGSWYVLDPYYLMGRSESQRTQPILAEDYIDYMSNRTPPRNFWGAAYFS